MFDNLNDSNSSNEQNQKNNFKGQKMTDSPFKTSSFDETGDNSSAEEKNKNLEQDSKSGSEQNQSEQNQKKQETSPKSSQEPQDMFSSVDPGEGKGLENRNQQQANNFQEAVNQAGPEKSAQEPASHRKDKKLTLKTSKKEIIIWSALFVLIAIVLAGIFYWVSNFLSSTPDNYQAQNQETSTNDLEDHGKQEPSEETNQTGTRDFQEEPDNVKSPQNKSENEDTDSGTRAVDTDGDGLTDSQEKEIGTDINNVDTDGDGLTDKEEFFIHKTDPLIPDTDKDGLTDYEEIKEYDTDPSVKDTDGDGYTDGEEVENGYNPRGKGKL